MFLGTYISRNEDVRRAGLVADVNALVLAVAVVLLLTSQATFNQAEEAIKHQAWANLLQDNPGAACATLNRQPFVGRISQGIHFHCRNANGRAIHPRWSNMVDGSNRGQVQAVLRALSDCNAFAMGMHYVYHDESIFYAAADESHSVRSIIDASDSQTTLEFDQGLNSWASLDAVTPEDIYDLDTRAAAGKRCAERMSSGTLASALAKKSRYHPCTPFGDPGFPGDLGFPPGMEIVRWLDRFGKGIYLGVSCNSSLTNASQDLQRCLNSSRQLGDAMGAWTSDFRDDAVPEDRSSFQLKGAKQGAFCPANGTLEISFFTPLSYRCNNGVQTSNASLLNDEVNALKGIRSFAYFRCMSYDELFGVYVGTVGVLMSVALATSALYVTDVARPLLLAGREDWSWDAAACVADPEAKARRYVQLLKVLDVVLRCLAGCAVGTALGTCLVYAPWQSFYDHNVATCNAA